MGGITSGVGIFSGIDTRSLINQLIQIEARPRALAQQRIVQLQVQQSGLLDINSRLQALQTAATAFRTNKTFQSLLATSSDPDALTARAGASAAPGSYQFVVDRLVSSQSLLSRGFLDKDTTAVGASAFTFEPAEARLDSDVALSDLNDGAGVQRGKITIQVGGESAVVDLSKAVTVENVLDGINSITAFDITARVDGDKLVLTSDEGAIEVTSETGRTTAEDLGIAKTSVTQGSLEVLSGDTVYQIGLSTPLTLLNDGKGVYQDNQIVGSNKFDFTIKVGTTNVNVNISEVYDSGATLLEARPATIGGVIDRINDALSGEIPPVPVTASLNQATGAIELSYDGSDPSVTLEVLENPATGGNTAADLGIVTPEGGVSLPMGASFSGQRLLAGMNSTLVRNLNGGAMDSFGDGMVMFELADGSAFTSDLSSLADGSVSEIISKIEADSGGLVRARINDSGTGLLVTDTTRAGGGTNPLIISGTPGTNTAAALGIETDPAGVNTATYSGGNLQHSYIGSASPLSALNGGNEVGTGTIVITDATGAREEFVIGSSIKSVGDLIREINTATAINVTASINDNGDGIIVRADGTGDGQAITITDESGAVARNVGIRGTASGTGADNYIDGTLETTVEFDPGDTLEDVVRKINEADPNVTAGILNTGVGSQPFKMTLTADRAGRDGRFVVDTNGFDLGIETLDEGDNAVVFFGGGNPASAQLLTSSSNTIEGVIQGVTIDLKSTGPDPIELTVTRDNEKIEEDVQAFIEAFNTVVSRIDFNTRYDEESETRGPLLGDATMIGLRTVLFNTVFGEAQNVSGQYSRLFDVGLTVEDGGKIGLDTEKFRQALEEDAASVEALFAERTLKKKEPQPIGGNLPPGILVSNPDQGDEFTSLGVVGQIEELARRYINSVDGVLTIKNRSIDDRIAVQNRRIDLLTARLEDRRGILEAQFAAMERAIAQLQQQQGALQSIG